jgi:choline dehydrogenase
MGSVEMAVIGTQLRVNGLQGLSQLDVSIMPNVVSVNTQPPLIMTGEKGAAIIKASKFV